MRSGWPSTPIVLGILAVTLLALAHRDEIRGRAEAALAQGMPAREAALARGFVLGQDEAIDTDTVEDFRRSGLSHLLAVSGQNVALLALLAMPVLAALAMPLRTRLVWILAAIALYVPLAGAGPSIVRAGVMGALAVLATLAGRRASSLFALAIAAIVTLAVDPRIGADVGWQLSFAAVLGILALATPLRRAIVARLGRGSLRRVVADGSAITVAASLATAPLIAFHFGALSTTTLVANLLVLPAVAPAMWLGMLVAACGQVPGFPVAALNLLAAPLLAYIAQVASWCGKPSWAYAEVELGLGGLVAGYVTLLAGALVTPALLRRRRLAVLKRRRSRQGRRGARGALVTSLALVVLAFAWSTRGSEADVVAVPPAGLRISVLDVGQGDAILLQPAGVAAVLVDGGPPGRDLVAKLRAAGVERLGAAVVTHEQLDHAGGVEELIGRFPIDRLLYARLSRRLREKADAAGLSPARIAAGRTLRVGPLRIEVLWPPQELLATSFAGTDPNTQSLVLLIRWGQFSMLLTGDAEAEVAPLDPGPVDVLKLAHHGSEDTGLAALLDRTAPRLAVISVGDDNPYGHPAPGSLAVLDSHSVPVLRTDHDGTVVLEVGRHNFRAIR